MNPLKCALHQFNPIVGDIDYNTQKIIDAVLLAKEAGADIFISSELALCGYSPQDLLLRAAFRQQIVDKLSLFLDIYGITMLLGSLYVNDGKCFNSVFVIRDGNIILRHDKKFLPNYSEFDEYRYFSPGTNSIGIFEHQSYKIGVIICEDMWRDPLSEECVSYQIDILCVVNASPFHIDKYHMRLDAAKDIVKNIHKPLIYVNQVGGQDDLIFDGGSFVLDRNAQIFYQLPAFSESLDYVVIEQPDWALDQKYHNQMQNNIVSKSQSKQSKATLSDYPCMEESVYRGLQLAIHDYVFKNAFKGVILGLSGGIDSALTLALAVDALGAGMVTTVMMPSIFTANISVTDARQMAQNLGVIHKEITIDSIFAEFHSKLLPFFQGLAVDTTEENLQSRIRGTILMALSNKFGYLVLTTGNKSEMATGYSTLYGDMAGGFAVLKDVPKTLVYKLSKWRNTLSNIIPHRVITRAPSAELRDNQTDQDSLPDYYTLDKIIKLLMEDGLSTNEIIAQGYDLDVVNKVVKLLKINEYKRYQAPVGPKITSCGFTKDWRYPITNHFIF